ncbi:hypothetical protein M527_23320 [Sphingobium indicum IP26]|nr:hypothetical protein M527_23320 [Sphingobium indicum IP26]EQB05377.1 hypothetical protein L286_07925 [Sphingobium sp. HDIP04]
MWGAPPGAGGAPPSSSTMMTAWPMPGDKGDG